MLGKNQMVVVESLANKVTVPADMGHLPAKISSGYGVFIYCCQPIEKLNHCVFYSCTYRVYCLIIICSVGFYMSEHIASFVPDLSGKMMLDSHIL